MSNDCVFCKIVSGELPSTKLYEDDDVLAFLDISPAAKGHALVIPKAHHETIKDIPAELLGKVSAVVKQIAQALFAGLGAEGVNVGQANGPVAGQVVPHIHFHVIPRRTDDGLTFAWSHQKYADSAEMQQLAAKITALLTPNT